MVEGDAGLPRDEVLPLPDDAGVVVIARQARDRFAVRFLGHFWRSFVVVERDHSQSLRCCAQWHAVATAYSGQSGTDIGIRRWERYHAANDKR
uniref:Uncharacterized protein n=1 Tax=Aquisalinus luteolus TaxID=1566827 RepID=A0A8J3A131_9PROT|nr:hypothetical protein GCM10011355_10630 [Aquisalinus luteolus]